MHKDKPGTGQHFSGQPQNIPAPDGLHLLGFEEDLIGIGYTAGEVRGTPLTRKPNGDVLLPEFFGQIVRFTHIDYHSANRREFPKPVMIETSIVFQKDRYTEVSLPFKELGRSPGVINRYVQFPDHVQNVQGKFPFRSKNEIENTERVGITSSRHMPNQLIPVHPEVVRTQHQGTVPEGGGFREILWTAQVEPFGSRPVIEQERTGLEVEIETNHVRHCLSCG